MDEKPEVIEEQIEETRHQLAEKLDKLEERFSGTVESVQETVENVTETVEHAVENVSETVETVTEAGKNAAEAVVSAFDIQQHADRHPWLVVGGSVLVGFVAGRLLGGGGGAPRRSQQGAAYGAPQMPQGDSRFTRQSYAEETPPARPKEESHGLFHGIMEKFGPQLDAVKGLALGSLFGLLRDVISQGLPSKIGSQLRTVFDDVTEKVGGKTIEGQVLDEDEDQHHGEEMGYTTEEAGGDDLDQEEGNGRRDSGRRRRRPQRR